MVSRAPFDLTGMFELVKPKARHAPESIGLILGIVIAILSGDPRMEQIKQCDMLLDLVKHMREENREIPLDRTSGL